MSSLNLHVARRHHRPATDDMQHLRWLVPVVFAVVMAVVFAL